MRIKVELHRDVLRYVRRFCDRGEADAFYEMLDRLRTEPIKHSEAYHDPRMSRFMLRFSRFGGNLAIFQYNLAQRRIRVIECRKAPSRRQSRKPKGERRPP